ncbi:hypothetical protein D9M68_932650 [compost metagenome]
MDIQHPAPLLGGGLGDAASAGDAGGVDQGVDAAEALHHLFHHRLHPRLVAHVQAQEQRRRAQALETGGDIRTRFADIQPDHLRAFLGETADAGQANTRCGASDDRDLVGKTCHGKPRCLFLEWVFGGVYRWRGRR